MKAHIKKKVDRQHSNFLMQSGEQESPLLGRPTFNRVQTIRSDRDPSESKSYVQPNSETAGVWWNRIFPVYF